MQDLSINCCTILNEGVNQSSSTKQHDHNISESISDILYKVSESKNKSTEEAISARTDSAVVLGWLKMPANRFKVFVAHRVAEITFRVDVDHWRYVSTHLNSADLISWGVVQAALTENSLWWSGPHWLALSPAHWPRRPDINRKQELPEIKFAEFITFPQPEEFGVRFSSFARLC